jgi:2-amino-4-hydroxy-6-hydroxymethyldihydropteridine diphosphokinase
MPPPVSSPGSPPQSFDVVVGLGANLGDRRATLHAAARSLQALGEDVRLSFVYESAPVGPPQPDFLNAAVRLSTTFPPLDLLEKLLAIERMAGRERRERWGPRTLDLDLLWIRGRSVALPGLVVPHPELCRRAFALLPLLDVAPDAADPTSGISYAIVLARANASGVRRATPERFDFS